MESASCTNGFSKLNSPAHRCLCLRFDKHLAMLPARLEARMDSLLSFPVGLFHPLQHAGLSRRSPGRQTGSWTSSGNGTALLAARSAVQLLSLLFICVTLTLPSPFTFINSVMPTKHSSISIDDDKLF